MSGGWEKKIWDSEIVEASDITVDNSSFTVLAGDTAQECFDEVDDELAYWRNEQSVATATNPVSIIQSNIDNFGGINITATNSGLTYTLLSPTASTRPKRYSVFNNDSSTYDIIVEGVTLEPDSAHTFYWTGTEWSNAEPLINSSEVINISNVAGITVTEALDNLNKVNNAGAVVIPTYTDNSNGTITIGTNGVFNFFLNSTATNGLIQLSATTGTTLSLTDRVINYVYCYYNSGSPIYGVSTDSTYAFSNGLYNPVFRISRYGNVIRVISYGAYGIALSNKLEFAQVRLNGFQRYSGLILSTAVTRISTITAGEVWFGVNVLTTSTNTSGSVGTLYEVYPTAGVWDRYAVNLYDSSYYSDQTDRLTLGTNKWVSKYFYMSVADGNNAYYMHGNQYTNLASALEEAIPTPPDIIASHCIYVGKIVIQQGSTNGTAYPRDWEGTIGSSSVTNHDDLAGINLAASGITYGHINDQAQTIAGIKTFSSIPTITGNYNTSYSQPLRHFGKYFFRENDFLGISVTSLTVYQDNILNAGAALSSGTSPNIGSTAGLSSNHIGVKSIVSSTSSNSGYYYTTTSTSSMVLGGYEVVDFIFQLITSTNTIGRFGFLNSEVINLFETTVKDGAYFEVSGTTLSGKVTNASATTTAGTTYTLSTGTWYRARIITGTATTTFKLYNESGTELLSTTATRTLPSVVVTYALHFYNTGTSSVTLAYIDYASLSIERELIR